MNRPSTKASALAILFLIALGAVPQLSALSPSKTDAASPSYTLTVATDSASYTGPQTIDVLGTVYPSPTSSGTAAFISVSAPDGVQVDATEAPVSMSGSFSTSLVAGGSVYWTSGKFTVTATYYGSSGTAAFQWSATQTFRVTISTDMTSYVAAQSVQLSGSVSPAPSSPSTAVLISVTAPDGRLVESLAPLVSTSGSFSGNFVAGGNLDWTSGTYVTNASYYGASAKATFQWSPAVAAIALSSSTGVIGTTFRMSGTGFAPDSPITANFDGILLSSPALVTADSSGRFTAVYAAPTSAPGNHVVTASDASGDTASQSFTLIASPTSTLVSCASASAAVGKSVQCTSVVTDSNPIVSITPTGQVSFTAQPSNFGGFDATSCTLQPTSSQGVSECSVHYTPTAAPSSNSITLTGTFAGDSYHSQSVGTASLAIAPPASKASTATRISCQTSSIYTGSSVACIASVSGSNPTGTVTWTQSYAGAASITFSQTSCTLSSGACSVTVTGSTAGPVTILGTYSGDPANAGSSSTIVLSVSLPKSTPTNLQIYSTSTASAQPGSVQSSTITVLALDQYGSPMGGVQVVLTVSAPGVLSAATVTTGSNGQATSTLTLSQSVSTSVTISVQASSGALRSQSIGVTFPPPAPPSLQVLSYTSTPNPFENSEFSVAVTVKNIGSETLQASQLPRLTGLPTSPLTDAEGQVPTLTCSPPGAQAVPPQQQVTLSYNCLAQWNIEAPADLLQTAFNSYVGLATAVVSDIAGSADLVAYAQNHLSPEAYQAFMIESKLASVSVTTLNNAGDVETFVTVIQLVGGNTLTLYSDFNLSLASTNYEIQGASGTVDALAPPQKFVEVYAWAAAKIAALGVSIGLGTAGTAVLVACATVLACPAASLLAGALYAASALAGPVTDALFQKALTDPSPNYASLVAIGPVPSFISSMPNNTSTQLLYYEYEYAANLNASVESSVRGYGAIQANSASYANVQLERASSFAANASADFSLLQHYLNLTLVAVAPNVNESSFYGGAQLLSQGKLPDTVTQILNATGTLGYFNPTALSSFTYQQPNYTLIANTIPNVGSELGTANRLQLSYMSNSSQSASSQQQTTSSSLTTGPSQASSTSPSKQLVPGLNNDTLVLAVAILLGAVIVGLSISRRKRP